ncbi:hypothetical protein TcasGA2_TC034709 [Tribolium castaneum]|uniref:Uncharacterized protein n=1 Tax=Tribolium castaneum TaxID=7070 RepID=A0A139WHR1_TRICA|nr:PREDICTED: uncharacterized protein LOC107398026 isoform X3 [Tribolium castaneum]KYB27395.1 hypothetical protein TcasGA2_TC034709 [Tribolium castaneum]|eukprot:XP_015836157.1 PREDICTED: uncharacterized protein LOC107398026 isoform X3 [Tribolium castaneum]
MTNNPSAQCHGTNQRSYRCNVLPGEGQGQPTCRSHTGHNSQFLGNVVSVVVWQLQDGFDDDSNLFASVGRCGILVPGRLTGLPGLATTYNWTVCDLFPIGSDN